MLLLLFVFIQVIPFTKWAVMTIDHHYFGVFVEKVPPLAITTANKNYYESKNLPYRTVDEIEQRKRDAKVRSSLGLAHPWDEEYYDSHPI